MQHEFARSRPLRTSRSASARLLIPARMMQYAIRPLPMIDSRDEMVTSTLRAKRSEPMICQLRVNERTKV